MSIIPSLPIFMHGAKGQLFVEFCVCCNKYSFPFVVNIIPSLPIFMHGTKGQLFVVFCVCIHT